VPSVDAPSETMTSCGTVWFARWSRQRRVKSHPSCVVITTSTEQPLLAKGVEVLFSEDVRLFEQEADGSSLVIDGVGEAEGDNFTRASRELDFRRHTLARQQLELTQALPVCGDDEPRLEESAASEPQLSRPIPGLEHDFQPLA